MRTLMTFAGLLLCASGWAQMVDPMRPTRPAEVPAAATPVQQQPWIMHVGGSAPAPEAAAAMAIEMRAIAPATAAELAALRGQSRSHVQGETPAALGPLSLAQPFDSRPPRFEQSFPSVLPDTVSPNAQGDLLTNFAGIADTGWFPPDTVVAVGPEHIVTATNVGYAIYSKTGRQIRGYTLMDTLFAGLRPANWAANGGFMFDPKVYYSRSHDKFVIFTLGRADTSQTSHFFVAISQTSDATRGWWMYRFDWPETTTWVDYSSISADTWGLYVTGNVYYWGAGFRYPQLWTINPAIFTNTGSNGWRFWDLRWPDTSLAFDLQAARPQTEAGGAESFFVNSSTASYNQMCLWKLTGDRTNAPTLVRASVPTGTYYPVYESVNQPDTTAHIDGFSTQVVEAAYSQRHVWATLTSGENSATPTWGGMYTARLNVDTNAMDWDALIWTAANFYTFPAVMVDPAAVTASAPHVGLFGTWTAPTRYASTIFHLNDPGGTNAFFTYRLGDAAYIRRDSSNRNRWGDYSGIAYDWTCGTVWGAAEYAGTTNHWGTQIAEVNFTGTAACPRIDTTAPNDGSVLYAGNLATVQWTRSNLTGSNQIYVYYYDNGGYVSQISGALSPTATSAVVTLPWATTTLGQLRVGSWNPTTSTWETADLSDAYFTLAAAPDLHFNSFTSPVTYVVTGNNLQLDTIVDNGGNGTAAATTLRFYRSADNVISGADTLLATSSIGVLAAGGTASRQLITTNTGTVGTWYFGACVDLVSNDPADNNCTAVPVTISVRTQNIFANGFE